MKTFFFAIGLIAFIVYRGTKIKVNLRGTWEGIYNKNEKKVDPKIIFGYNKRSEMNKPEKITRSSMIGNNSKIAIISRNRKTADLAFSRQPQF
jgi:hypothetical protein